MDKIPSLVNTDGIPYANAAFGAGSGEIVLDDVRCSSSSNQLLECPSSPLLSSNCDHRHDAGVGCEGLSQHTYLLLYLFAVASYKMFDHSSVCNWRCETCWW